MVTDVPTQSGPARVVDPIEVASNATFELSATCGGGNGGPWPNGARLAFWRLDDHDRKGGVRGVFSVGQLLPACGKLYRFAGLLPDGGVLIDRAPAPLPSGVSIGANTLVVPLQGSGDLGFSRVSVEAIERKGKDLVARLTVKEVEFAKGSENPPTRVATRPVQVSAGAKLTVLGKTHPVVNVVAPDAASGIPGWVEIGGPERG